MSRDKQIEEMTEIICQNTEFDTMIPECEASAKALYTAGYRKSTEIARNIFGNLRILGHIDFDGNFCIRKDAFEELEKKYTEGDG